MNPIIKKIIAHYQFDKIPIEGTLYKSSFVADKKYKNSPISTAIIGMYCHQPQSHSTFHRLQHDEVWHFYDGDPFALHLLFPNGQYQKIIMGKDILNGQQLQFVVPANVWQAGALLPDGLYALFGCTMSPGFTGNCFEGGFQADLLEKYREQSAIIKRLGVKGGKKLMPNNFEQ